MSVFHGRLGEIEEAAGTRAASILAVRVGGTRIALSDAEGSQLVQLVGKEAAEKIVQALGRGHFDVPMAHLRGQKARRAEALRQLRSGASVRDVALKCDVHERTVWRVKAGAKASDERDLFDD